MQKTTTHQPLATPTLCMALCLHGMATTEVGMGAAGVEILAYHQPQSLSQDSRLVHHQEVYWYVYLLHTSYYLHLYCFRHQRKPSKVLAIPCASQSNSLRLLCQFCTIFCKSIQSSLRLHCRHLLHFKVSWQLGNHLYACIWYILQTAYATLYVFLHTYFLPIILSQCIRDTPWNRHKTEFRDHV